MFFPESVVENIVEFCSFSTLCELRKTNSRYRRIINEQLRKMDFTSLDDMLNINMKIGQIAIKENMKNRKNFPIYMDLRIGCSICSAGNASGFTTNIADLLKKEEFFLGDIRINLEEDDIFQLSSYYACFEKAYFEKLFDIYCKLGKSSPLVEHYSLNSEDNLTFTYKKWESGITTVFEDLYYQYKGEDSFFDNQLFDDCHFLKQHLHEIPFIPVCHRCVRWLKLLDISGGKPHFYEAHPLMLFWENILNDVSDGEGFFCSEAIKFSFASEKDRMDAKAEMENEFRSLVFLWSSRCFSYLPIKKVSK